jgi:sodium-dependent dicarboxylate transporter 2/3/5
MRVRKAVGIVLGVTGFAIPFLVQFPGLSYAGHLALAIFLLAAAFWILEPIPIYSTSVLVILLGALLLSAQGPVYMHAKLAWVEPVSAGGDIWELPASAVSAGGEAYLVTGTGSTHAVRLSVLGREAGSVRVRSPRLAGAKVVADARQPLAGYTPSAIGDYFNTLANPIIILFLGGILLADAAVKFNLDKNLTRLILKPFGNRPAWIVLGLLLVTGIVSAFMSNTATTAMMMTVILPIIAQIEPDDPLRRAVVLAIPFGANIGGIATPVGTPPNAIALAGLAKAGVVLPFGTWCLLAAPLALLMLGVAWWVLITLFPPRRETFELELKGRFDRSPKAMALYAIGGITVVLWMTEALHGISSALVAFFAVVALTVTGVVKESDIQKVEWDVLWLVAGGIALEVAMKTTGLGAWLVSRVAWEHLGRFAIVVTFGVVALALAEFLSHTICATLTIPLALNLGALGAVGPGFDLTITCLVIGTAVSFAMVLPISTPPNAIATSTGMLNTRDMAKAGFVIGIAGILLTLLFAQVYWPYIIR